VPSARLNTAVTWGRYAELFDYDAGHRRFVLPDAQDEEIAASEGPSEDPASSGADAGPRPHLAIFIDLTVVLCALAFFLGMIRLGTYWMPGPRQESSSPAPSARYPSMPSIPSPDGHCLPAQPGLRGRYGYIAAYNRRVEAWMLAVLDICNQYQCSVSCRSDAGDDRLVSRPSARR